MSGSQHHTSSHHMPHQHASQHRTPYNKVPFVNPAACSHRIASRASPKLYLRDREGEPAAIVVEQAPKVGENALVPP
eukprot:438760-Rhodomonas_salina.1